MDNTGITTVGDPIYGLACCFFGELQFHGGLLYTNGGPPHAFDPERHIVLGTYPNVTVADSRRAYAVDEDTGIIYFGKRAGFVTQLVSYNAALYTLQALFTSVPNYSQTNPGLQGSTEPLILCGPQRLAAIDSGTGQIWIFSRDILQPIEPPSPPAVTDLGDGIRSWPDR